MSLRVPWLYIVVVVWSLNLVKQLARSVRVAMWFVRSMYVHTINESRSESMELGPRS